MTPEQKYNKEIEAILQELCADILTFNESIPSVSDLVVYRKVVDKVKLAQNKQLNAKIRLRKAIDEQK